MIAECSFGRMRVADEVHTKDLIVFGPGVRGEAEHIVGDWWRKDGHAVVPDDLAAIEGTQPAILVIGCGAHGRVRVPETTLAWLRERGIEPEVCATTARAAERYNELLAAGRPVAGAFHLTC